MELAQLPLWDRMKAGRAILAFDVEVTARCNNNCRHCYINLPAGDRDVKKRELSLEEIGDIAEEAVSLGALWCLLTGGEPLLRDDFFDLYLNLKRKGLLVSVFTNATLITGAHVRLFKRYPPKDLEVSVYGVTEKTYENVTRKPGSFKAFKRGLDLLLKEGVKVRLKVMALRSNVHEMPEMARFCRERTMDYFRFDPFLHLRFDHDEKKNQEIMSQRLSPLEITALEQTDPDRFDALKKSCGKLIRPEFSDFSCNHLFHCGVGIGEFTLSYDGFFRLCSSLSHPECIYDLKAGNLTQAWRDFVPKVRNMHSDSKEFLEKCCICPIINLCMWCPAYAYLETGEMDAHVDYFCDVAQARRRAIENVAHD
jgi:radical SAM protein with 4Fe4S-binding SPASM domain